MNFLTIAAVVIFIGVAFFAKGKTLPSTPEIKGDIDAIASPSPEPSPSSSLSPSPAPSNLSSPTPTPNPSPHNLNLEQFIYPSSTLITTTGSTLNLNSQDNPDQITTWYQQKIISLGLNTKSFVTTKANDKVVNKLVGASSELEISVEINRPPQSATTDITVTIISR